MSDPHVRPDVRAFLDHYNRLPGPRAHEVAPDAARAGIEALKLILKEVAR